MSLMERHTKTGIQLLGEDNWATWSIEVSDFLKTKGVWHVVSTPRKNVAVEKPATKVVSGDALNGATKKPVNETLAETPTIDLKEDVASGLISSHLTKRLKKLVRGLRARDAWQKLELHAKSMLSALHTRIDTQYGSTKWENDDNVATFCNKFESLQDNMDDAGYEQSEYKTVLRMRQKLPSRFFQPMLNKQFDPSVTISIFRKEVYEMKSLLNQNSEDEEVQLQLKALRTDNGGEYTCYCPSEPRRTMMRR